MTNSGHQRSIVVWGMPGAVACGERLEFVVGLKCSHGCGPDRWAFEVRDDADLVVAEGHAGDRPWQDTDLYFAHVEVTAPPEPGLYRWHVVAPQAGPEAESEREPESEAEAEAGAGAALAEGSENIRHAFARFEFNVRAVPAGDHLLTVIAVDRESQTPVAGLRVVAHPFRATTDTDGKACLRLPRGEYRVFVSGRDYFPYRSDGELNRDVTLRAEMEHDRAPSDAELWS